MKLTVTSKHSLEDLEKWVLDYFQPVINKKIVLPKYDQIGSTPFTHANLGKIQKYKPIMDHNMLTMIWILPNCQDEFRS